MAPPRGHSWWDVACDVIAKEVAERRERDPTIGTHEMLNAIRLEAYPFGERKMWPYKAWLRAIRDWRDMLVSKRGRLYVPTPDENQTKLFDPNQTALFKAEQNE